MKYLFISFLLVLTQLAGSAQKQATEANIQKRTVGSFTRIESSAGIEVILTHGTKEEVAVATESAEYLDRVKTTVSGGTLRISRDGDWKFWNNWKGWKIRVYVAYVNLEALDVSSGSIVRGEGLELSKLSVDINSGAIVELKGTTTNLIVEASSGANFKGYGLKTSKCTADVSSGANVQVTVDKEINAEASSGGSIRYKGEGLIRNINTSSGGGVRKVTDN